jgi:predicted DNA-binding WGR domain protein
MTAVYLRRVDSARNMSRFYRLDMQPDLFGGVLLVKEWGRLGAHGRIVAERYDSEALATDALRRQVERKGGAVISERFNRRVRVPFPPWALHGRFTPKLRDRLAIVRKCQIKAQERTAGRGSSRRPAYANDNDETNNRPNL